MYERKLSMISPRHLISLSGNISIAIPRFLRRIHTCSLLQRKVFLAYPTISQNPLPIQPRFPLNPHPFPPTFLAALQKPHQTPPPSKQLSLRFFFRSLFFIAGSNVTLRFVGMWLNLAPPGGLETVSTRRQVGR